MSNDFTFKIYYRHKKYIGAKNPNVGYGYTVQQPGVNTEHKKWALVVRPGSCFKFSRHNLLHYIKAITVEKSRSLNKWLKWKITPHSLGILIFPQVLPLHK